MQSCGAKKCPGRGSLEGFLQAGAESLGLFQGFSSIHKDIFQFLRWHLKRVFFFLRNTEEIKVDSWDLWWIKCFIEAEIQYFKAELNRLLSGPAGNSKMV